MMQIKQDIDNCITNCNYQGAVVTSYEVYEAVKMLQKNKSDGSYGYDSNHLIYASPMYFEHIALLLSVANTHGYQPDALLKASICSIPKDYRKNLQDSDNYRGIAL
jgi:hypothetical protein